MSNSAIVFNSTVSIIDACDLCECFASLIALELSGITVYLCNDCEKCYNFLEKEENEN